MDRGTVSAVRRHLLQLQGVVTQQIGFQAKDRPLGLGTAATHLARTDQTVFADDINDDPDKVLSLGTVGMARCA